MTKSAADEQLSPTLPPVCASFPSVRCAGMPETQKKILCIEDDRETAALIAEELVDRGYAVTLAHDGREGLAAILKTMPDLVLSDISMPAMSGFELLERLIALAPRFAKMPFVFLTALTDRDNELKGRQLGADDYVTKPIDFDVLATIITRAARRRRAHRAVAEDRRAERSRGRGADLGGARQDLGGDRADRRPDQAHRSISTSTMRAPSSAPRPAPRR